MNLSRVVLVLALVYAAAVLIPLRRAQRLFSTPASLSLSNTQRPLVRRRLVEPRAVLRRDVHAHAGAAATSDVTTPAVPRRRLAYISNERHTLEKQQSPHTVTAAAERHVGGPAHADCDRAVERSTIDLRPQPLVQSVAVEAFAVPAQAAADLAVPPPKLA